MAPNDTLATATENPSEAQPARVSFREPIGPTGFIDGGWWPRSRDLAAELPPLLDVFWAAHREIVHISYNIDSWDAAPRRLRIAGRRVRLAGFHGQNPLTVFVSDSRHGDTAEMLLVAPETDAGVAQRALDLASATGGTDRAQRMFENAQADA
jgi:hypothetical protein